MTDRERVGDLDRVTLHWSDGREEEHTVWAAWLDRWRGSGGLADPDDLVRLTVAITVPGTGEEEG